MNGGPFAPLQSPRNIVDEAQRKIARAEEFIAYATETLKRPMSNFERQMLVRDRAAARADLKVWLSEKVAT